MNFLKVKFSILPCEEYLVDVLIYELAEIGFDSFESENSSVEAYISTEIFDDSKIKKLIENFLYEVNITYEVSVLEEKNWNEEWEKNYFSPIVIGNECVIHSSFHKNIPNAKYDIVIDPKMAFGTGHHETTSLMISAMLTMNLDGKKVLDMGCGTAVLAILAKMRGAGAVIAIDIDKWCTENSLENISLNRIQDIEVLLGGAELLKEMHFDLILANINRNILINDMHLYASCLSAGGELYMSGFYEQDIPIIENECKKNCLKLLGFQEKNNWVVIKTIKE
jgi:ribosomal protein L11 methyltransferase